MTKVIYFGHNEETLQMVQFLPGRVIRQAHNYLEVQRLCAAEPHINFIILFERQTKNEDLTAISYLNAKVPNAYIILLIKITIFCHYCGKTGCGFCTDLFQNLCIRSFRRFGTIPL